ncbi:hypothetical protein ETAA8_52810 [Anatilimnocola aggregata]|uniref:DUF1553 domain-containing protein n=1 Tax=Anatilimnocola aggregata TaxID=2528021 RepID=A0A517YIW9_9BACT|nr:DUF1549 domain-containing protein [Anatilimnocola aggregata]QDU30162.1 hypothetical protein ETAA8_52810 [Anatilimnocola aggregata]
MNFSPCSRSPSIWLLLVGVLNAALLVHAEDRPLRDVIDSEISAVWQREKLTPAAPSSDAEFLRRIYLDLAGIIPTYDEATAFLKDQSPDKRQQLIDCLLDHPRYAQHQADLWDLILFGRNPPGFGTDKREGIQNWLKEQFAANRPYDEMIRDLLRAEGNSVEQGPPMYYVQFRNQPEDLNEKVTQTFLGVQLQCARCHDHPFDDWKQTDFFGMAAFFARLTVVEVGKKDNIAMYVIGEKNSGDVLFTGPAKDQTPGKKGEPIKPKFLLGGGLDEPALPEGYKEPKLEEKKPPPPPTFSRKDKLVEWIARADNPYFARAIANRMWGQYLGRGIVHPVDNLSPANEPSHPALLDAITIWLVEKKFDLKALTRELLNSNTYQLSSRGTSGEAQPMWFQHARVRPLSAEELGESWRIATGYDEATKDKPPEKTPSRFRPLNRDYVVRFFGQPNNGTGDFQGGLAEHLYFNNGELGSLLLRTPGSLLGTIINKEMSGDERIERLFLQILSRPPTTAEREKFIEMVNKKDVEDRVNDLVWALLTCSEFRFNH